MFLAWVRMMPATVVIADGDDFLMGLRAGFFAGFFFAAFFFATFLRAGFFFAAFFFAGLRFFAAFF
ncbi:MAG: hypothetical protein ACKOAT_03835, partial [Actinomycetota bacterium]